MMRQEAGNLSSGTVSLSFDLGWEHTEEASGADPVQGEAPAGGMKPNTRPSGCRPVGARGAVTAPEPQTPLLAQDCAYSQVSSQPCLHVWLWPPPGRWDCAVCPTLGTSWGAGAVSARQQHPPARLREGGGE